jgi:hypothetical protein
MSLSKVTVQYAKMEVGCTTVPTVYQAELRRLRDENSRLRKKVIHARFENITLEDALKKAEARLESEHVKDLESIVACVDNVNIELTQENDALSKQVENLSELCVKRNLEFAEQKSNVKSLKVMLAKLGARLRQIDVDDTLRKDINVDMMRIEFLVSSMM